MTIQIEQKKSTFELSFETLDCTGTPVTVSSNHNFLTILDEA